MIWLEMVDLGNKECMAVLLSGEEYGVPALVWKATGSAEQMLTVVDKMEVDRIVGKQEYYLFLWVSLVP